LQDSSHDLGHIKLVRPPGSIAVGFCAMFPVIREFSQCIIGRTTATTITATRDHLFTAPCYMHSAVLLRQVSVRPSVSLSVTLRQLCTLFQNTCAMALLLCICTFYRAMHF